MDSVIFASVVLSIVASWGLAWLRGRRERVRPLPTYERQSAPAVSILIPAWNERAILGRCVTSLKKLAYPNWECIVIAGGNDQTAEFVRELVATTPNFRVVDQRDGGKNAALNDGLQIARGDIIVLLDADCEVEPEWLGAIIAPVVAGVDASLGNYFPDLITPIALQFEMNKLSTYFIRRSTILHGGAIALSRQAIEKIGGCFAEKVLVGTDWDLNQRLELAGATKAFATAARHTTPLPATLKQFVRNEIRWRRAHFLSVLRFSKEARWWTCIVGLAPYVAGLFLVVAPLAALLLYFLRIPASAYYCQAWLVYMLWIMGRRISQAIEIASYTGDKRWFKHFWVPPITLLISLYCGTAALITLRSLSPHFKGYRPQIASESQHG